MGDLISRKALFKAWDGLSDEIKDSNLLIDEMIRRTQDAKTVDADPVKRARWKPSPVPFAMPICSACGEMGYFNWVACPHCGARMDGGEKDG